MTEKWKLIRKESTSSTNDDVATLLDRGVDRVAVVSTIQTSGRGRKGNFWHSPKGGVWLSMGFHCNLKATDLVTPFVTTMARALEQHYAGPFTVKLPNDIFLNGKKVMGILMETKIQNDRILRIILGMGLNVENEIPEEISLIATSLKEEGIHTTVEEAFDFVFKTASSFFERLENIS